MTIQNWYAGAANKLDYFLFADDTQITVAQAETAASTSWCGSDKETEHAYRNRDCLYQEFPDTRRR
jgi:hypothetical protein